MEIKETVSLEINGKKYDFRFYEETREVDLEKEEMLCEVYCPFAKKCNKIPDPRTFVNPGEFDKSYTFNDFCLDPHDEFTSKFGESIHMTLSKHRGEVVNKEQLISILKKETTIEKCLDLGYLRKLGDDKFEFIEFKDPGLYNKFISLSEEDRKFISSPADGSSVPDFMGSLMPVPEDIERYINEVIENN